MFCFKRLGFKRLVSKKVISCAWPAVPKERFLLPSSLIPTSVVDFASNYRGKTMSGGSELAERLIWVDLEMTGLDPDKDKIMEGAVVITDKSLNIIAQSKNLVINVNEEALNNMGDWCKQTHRESGLSTECQLSSLKVEDADDIFFNLVQQHTPAGRCALAGNSVSYDRAFMRKYLPKLESHIHYRIVDVSTIKEVLRRWQPGVFSKAPRKKLCHRALDDILESISELRYYKNTVFTPQSGDSKT